MWVHGGGFTTGSKSSGERWATLFAKQGYVAVSIDYRLLSATGCGGQPAPSPQCLQAALAAQYDAQAAVRWLRANADARRIDRGADRHRRLLGGRGDLGAARDRARTIRAAAATRATRRRCEARFRCPAGRPPASSSTPATRPRYFLHGTADTTVPYSWAVGNAAAMYNLGIEVWLNPLEGVGHGLPASARPIIDEQSELLLLPGDGPGERAPVAPAHHGAGGIRFTSLVIRVTSSPRQPVVGHTNDTVQLPRDTKSRSPRTRIPSTRWVRELNTGDPELPP